MFMALIQRVDKVRYLGRGIFVLSILYSVVLSFLLFRNQPKTLIIGVDSSGTKILTDSNEKLLQGEVLSFLKSYIALTYRYTSETYESQLSRSGDFLTDELWNEKQASFKAIGEKLKSRDLIQNAAIQGITQIDANKYTAQLQMSIQEKLTTRSVKLKVTVETIKAPRSPENPYPIRISKLTEEVES